MRRVMITGSSGLIGSEAVVHYDHIGCEVPGADNNMRREFFGPKEDTLGEVYNLGGGRANSASILECFSMLEDRLGRPVRWKYAEQNRQGDHICYIIDLSRITAHYPNWRITRSLDSILDEMVAAELAIGAPA